MGSLLYMPYPDIDEKIYMVRIYTPGFSSKEHVNDIKSSNPRSKQQLFNEDKHQLLVTLKVLRKIKMRAGYEFDIGIFDELINRLDNKKVSLKDFYLTFNKDTNLF